MTSRPAKSCLSATVSSAATWNWSCTPPWALRVANSWICAARCDLTVSSKANSLLSSAMRWDWHRHWRSSASCSSAPSARARIQVMDRSVQSCMCKPSCFLPSASGCLQREAVDGDASPPLSSAAPIPAVGLVVATEDACGEDGRAKDNGLAVEALPCAKAMTTSADRRQVDTRSLCNSLWRRACEAPAACNSATKDSWAELTSLISWFSKEARSEELRKPSTIVPRKRSLPWNSSVIRPRRV
mmetsp:Transcript_82175/g.182638  ORF Transcript_82175/g.182638 Transcript_82175/m.182638 type:complete len:243 (+) Transcript_82175:328-1056(+)